MQLSHTPVRRTLLAVGTALVLLVAGSCGDDDVATTAGDPGEDAVTQPDQPTSSPEPGGDFGEDFSAEDAEEARQRARDLLGTAEADLPGDVRVARRGEEQFMLTEDYVLGRITVELDDDGSGTFVVTSAVVELPDGPETFDADGT